MEVPGTGSLAVSQAFELGDWTTRAARSVAAWGSGFLASRSSKLLAIDIMGNESPTIDKRLQIGAVLDIQAVSP